MSMLVKRLGPRLAFGTWPVRILAGTPATLKFFVMFAFVRLNPTTVLQSCHERLHPYPSHSSFTSYPTNQRYSPKQTTSYSNATHSPNFSETPYKLPSDKQSEKSTAPRTS